MNLIPVGFPYHDMSQLHVDPLVFAPSNDRYDSGSIAEICPPGCLFVFLQGMFCGVMLDWKWDPIMQQNFGENERTVPRKRAVPMLIPQPFRYEIGMNYRKATWRGEFSEQRIAVGDTLYFAPEKLEFTAEQAQHASRGEQPSYKFSSDAFVRMFLRFGLVCGERYCVEVAYPEPFIKVQGVDFIMTTEVWTRQPNSCCNRLSARAQIRREPPRT